MIYRIFNKGALYVQRLKKGVHSNFYSLDGNIYSYLCFFSDVAESRYSIKLCNINT